MIRLLKILNSNAPFEKMFFFLFKFNACTHSHLFSTKQQGAGVEVQSRTRIKVKLHDI